MFGYKRNLNRLYKKRFIYTDAVRTCILLGSIKERTKFEIKLMNLNNKIERINKRNLGHMSIHSCVITG